MLDASSLTFTSSNWNVPQTVIVTGLDDDVADSTADELALFGPATGTDANYTGFAPEDLTVLNYNDNFEYIDVIAS